MNGLRIASQFVLSNDRSSAFGVPAQPVDATQALNLDFGRQRKATMIRKFPSPVPGQGLIQSGLRSSGFAWSESRSQRPYQLGLKAQQEAVMTEKIKSEVISRRRVFSLLGLAASSLVLATIPVSPQVTPGGVELSVDQAQAVTYRRARVTARRVNRRAYRHTRRAVRRGVY
jgi:hypothetical protein